MGMLKEKPALMFVFLKRQIPELIFGFPSQVTKILIDMYGANPKVLRSVRIIKEVDYELIKSIKSEREDARRKEQTNGY